MADISKVNGVAIANISKIIGFTLSDNSKILGQTKPSAGTATTYLDEDFNSLNDEKLLRSVFSFHNWFNPNISININNNKFEILINIFWYQ